MKQTIMALLVSIFLSRTALAENHLLVISGLGGEPEFSELFQTWSNALLDAAEQRLGLPAARITYLAEDPGRDAERSDGRSTRAGIESALAGIKAAAEPGDSVFIVLIGHGNQRADDALFNIPGPDISATELATLLDEFAEQRVIMINTTAASGSFLPVLSAPGRVVVTATASGAEDNFALFGGHFVAAFGGDGADTDKNKRVSVLEAFDYARREVQREYLDNNHLPTEHALLDDNGDSEGSPEPDPRSGDGALARTVFLQEDRPAATADAIADPALAALLEAKRTLENQIEVLKTRKDELPPTEYETRLEDLLVELALKNRDIRQHEAGQ